MVAGHYRFVREETATGWKINGIILETLYQSGNAPSFETN